MAATREQILATIDRYVAAFAADRTGWISQFTEDATIEDPVGSDVQAGTEAIGAFWDMTHSLAESIRMERTGPVRMAGGQAAFPFVIHTDVGGATMVLDVIDVMTFADDGRITSQRAFWDMADMRPLEG